MGFAQSDTIRTPSGKSLVITPIKHGSLRINFDGREIQIDPVAKLQPETNYKNYPKADYIFVTHNHFDHMDSTAIADLSYGGTIIVSNADAAQQLPEAIAVGNNYTIDFGFMEVRVVAAYNTSADKLQFHPRGRDNGYIFNFDGIRLYIAGDTEVIPEMAGFKDIDIAFLPCNLPYTMTPEQLNEAARIIQPKILYPYHFSDTPMDRVTALLKDSGIDVRIRNFQ